MRGPRSASAGRGFAVPGTRGVRMLTGASGCCHHGGTQTEGNPMGHRPNMYRIKDVRRFRQMMTDNDISCRHLAVLAGCSRDTTSNLWNGRIDRVNEHIARGICLAFDLRLEELFVATGSVAWQRTGGAIKAPAGRNSKPTV